SCTTHGLAPMVKVLDEHFKIESGLMTTIHSFTSDQKSLDNPHKDLRRARASSDSIIPTTTGAAKSIGKVLPALDGKLNGVSVRVPTPNVSLIDLVVDVEKIVSSETVNQMFYEEANQALHGLLGITDEPLVSVDFNGDAHSCIVDGLSTTVMEGRK